MSAGMQAVTGAADAGPATGDAGALLGSAGVLIWNDIAPEGREAFYAWHDKEHVPERLAIPGFRRGRRYARPGHSPEWFTMYEADDLAVLTSPAYLERLNAPTPATRRTLVHFRRTSRAVCRVACSMGSSSGGYMLTLRLSGSREQDAALRRWIAGDAFVRAMARTGVVACHLYAADDLASYVRTAVARDRAFDVPSWVVLVEASLAAAAEHARTIIEGPERAALGIAVRDDKAVYALELCRLSR
jgi:hypothetical protein